MIIISIWLVGPFCIRQVVMNFNSQSAMPAVSVSGSVSDPAC